jgi:hypothetical protein
MPPRNSTPRGKTASEKEQPGDGVKESQPSMEVMGEASVKLKPSASKVSRKDLPNRSYKQPIKVARQKSTVESCNDSVSGIKVLQQKPDSRQLPKRISPKRKSSGTTFFRVRHPKPAGERRNNSQRASDMLRRMKIKGKNLKCLRVRGMTGRGSQEQSLTLQQPRTAWDCLVFRYCPHELVLLCHML